MPVTDIDPSGHATVGVTCLRSARWAVVWDSSEQCHRYATDVDVAFDRGGIISVGRRYEGPVQRELDGRDRMVMPGLINVHSHPNSEPIKKGFREEFGNPQMHMSPLYDRAFMFQTDAAGACLGLQYSVAELLRSGVTTVVDLSFAYDGWLETMAATGIRSWLVPGYASARWSTSNGHSVDYVWDEAKGHEDFALALQLADDAVTHPSGRIGAMVGPAQIDTCTEELLVASLDAARDRGWKLHVHAAQSVVEFYEMTRRTGTTPIQWADKIGLLGPDTVLAHAMFTDEHHATHWPGRRDRRLLAESGTHVAHCPGVFARNGQALEDLGGYVRAGINVGIGTDSFPLNMLEEMRVAALLARVVTDDVGSVSTAEIFHAATVGGAQILGRTDLGRLEVGAAADLVTVDLTCPAMMPLRDPLRSLIYTAADRAVADVFVAGSQVVADGEIVTFDVASVCEQLQQVRDRAERDAPEHHYAGLAGVEVAPLTLPFAKDT